MAYRINDNPKLVAPKNLDARYGPWPSTEDALVNVPLHMRARGLTVGIIEDGEVVEYWFKEGILNSNLTPKGGGGIVKHSITDPSYHKAGTEDDLGKSFRYNPITGLVEAYHPDFSKNYQVFPPDVNSVRVGDSWTEPYKLKEFRLIEQDGERWWVETTSPRLLLAKLFDHTFDKSFN
jgi:hypothetical protein